MWRDELEGGDEADEQVPRDLVPTVIPPAAECCGRCGRILLEGPCRCDPVGLYLRAEAVRDAAWRALTLAQRAEARRRRDVGIDG